MSTTTSVTSARRSWRVLDIIVASVLAVACGVVFWLWSLAWTPLSALLSFLEPLSGLLNGGWLIGGVLGALIIRKPGAALLDEVVAAAVEAVGCAEQGDCQQELIDWLHENSVDTIVGTLSWDEAGRPDGAHLIQQYVDGEIAIVLPEETATTELVYPKPEW